MSVSSTSTDPVAAVVEILSGVSDTTWTLSPPSVDKRQNTTQQERENNPNPALYVWSPVDADISQQDAEGSFYSDRRTIEVSAWVLQSADTDASSECHQYHEDVISILRQYSNDNETNTQFHHIRPTTASDYRQEAIASRTDHEIMTVQADVQRTRQ